MAKTMLKIAIVVVMITVLNVVAAGFAFVLGGTTDQMLLYMVIGIGTGILADKIVG